MEQDITDALLAQLPSMHHPHTPTVDVSALRIRLNLLDRQDLVLTLARWLHDNELHLGDVAFTLAIDDCRVFLEDDEITLAGDIDNGQDIVHAVNELVELLDGSVDDENADMLERIFKGLNQVGWDMPAAWTILEQQAPTDGTMPGAQWLGEHRAAWQAGDLQATTQATPAATSPKRRM